SAAHRIDLHWARPTCWPRVYFALGIDPDMEIRNHLNQPRELVKGKPVIGLWSINDSTSRCRSISSAHCSRRTELRSAAERSATASYVLVIRSHRSGVIPCQFTISLWVSANGRRSLQYGRLERPGT